MRLRGTVPPPCRRSAFNVAVEAENGRYTWLRLRAPRGLPRPPAAFRGFPRPCALRIACTFRAHSAPSANRGTFRNFRAWPSMTRPTEYSVGYYRAQLAEPDPAQVSDLKISHGKWVKKKARRGGDLCPILPILVVSRTAPCVELPVE